MDNLNFHEMPLDAIEWSFDKKMQTNICGEVAAVWKDFATFTQKKNEEYETHYYYNKK